MNGSSSGMQAAIPKHRDDGPYQLYPRRYFDLSPTWFAWNKLTAADVHALRDERGFEGQHVAFHLNLPIQFVCVVGLVVDIELTRGGGLHTLVTLDDGSGACIQARISRRDAIRETTAQSGGGGGGVAEKEVFPSNTRVDCLDVHVNFGLPTVCVDREPIDIGTTVLKVKARLDSFRGTRQLRPERVWIVRDTNAEARAWMETAEWKRECLARPWVLTDDAAMARVDDRVRAEADRERKREKEAREWRKSRANRDENKRRHAEKREAKRRLEEQQLNAGALLGSHLVSTPWEHV